MKSLVLAVSVVALATPVFACGESKSTKLTWEAVRKREPGALKKLTLWVATAVLPQLLARKGGHIMVASANAASVGTVLHAGGDIFENERAQEWGRNCWFYALASELLRIIPGASSSLDKAFEYTKADLKDSGFDQKTVDANTTAQNDARGVAKAVIATAILKLVIEKGPELFSAAKECAETEAKLPTAAA